MVAGHFLVFELTYVARKPKSQVPDCHILPRISNAQPTAQRLSNVAGLYRETRCGTAATGPAGRVTSMIVRK